MTGADAREAPLILAASLDGEAFGHLDDLRRRHFPPERNVVPAHLTLFHALPGGELSAIRRELDRVTATERPFDLEATGFRSLGRGVALAFSSPDFLRIRQGLAREWSHWLTPQDQARIAPHVTVQNKVTPEVARRTLADLSATFRPFAARVDGLILHRYLGGLWQKVALFRLRGG